ncbi:MAG TPA: VWA domain-containing protein, partial [Pyrinomonadaceae bacterium]|nr:VWA domain-containing protein [Pyrinomonadaceae bacterium]
ASLFSRTAECSRRSFSSPCNATNKYSPCLLLKCALLLVTTTFAAPFINAQSPDADDVVRIDTRLVVFPIRVRDKRSALSAKLTASDLTLKDEDQVTNGVYLYPGADRVSLVFALDQSGSVREVIDQQRAAALSLFERFGNRSQIAVLKFAEQSQVAVQFGRDVADARAAFAASAERNQHTAIFDAAARAVEMFQGLPRLRSERRLVILISDGLDNASATSPSSVIQAALKSHVTFYIVHLPLFTPAEGRLKVREPSKGFRDLAEKTGGKYFLVKDNPLMPSAIDLSKVFEAIEEDLRSQYLLGFYTKELITGAAMHRVIISVPQGVEYQPAGEKFSRKHEFFVTQ